jgi:phosphoglycerate dehydrogenase-like enzyme
LVAKIGVVVHTDLRARIFSPEEIERMNTLGEVVWTDSPTPISVQEAVQLLKDCEIGVGSWGTPHPNAELMAGCPKLKLWEHTAGSVKHMFGPHLDGRDLKISSCGTAIADCVAEMTLGEIIIGVRGILPNAAANRDGNKRQPANVKTLSTGVVGIVGASNIGKRMIKLLRPFGAKVLLYDPYLSEDTAAEMGVELIGDLAELCAESDVVTLHTPALPSTAKIMGAREFQAMKDDAVFINTSRGMCVDENALITELEKGRLFAFLDVTDPEPPAGDSPLRQLPNVIYTSHIAGPADFRLGKQAVDDVDAYLNGRQPMYIVTSDMLDRIA